MEILNDIKEACLLAGSFLRETFGKERVVEHKGVIDIVTDADKKAEDIIITYLKEKHPTFGFLTEERDEVKGEGAYRFIIDPIDGTTNFAHGFPFFCVSIALEKKGEIIMGAVYDPIAKEMFEAELGKGAFLNDKQIFASDNKKLIDSLICTGFPYDVATSEINNLENFTRVIKKAQALRRTGSAALDICCVACGRFDGFWEVNLKPWDVAAAYIIATEAGAKVTGFNKKDFGLYNKNIIATNEFIFDEIEELLK